MEKANGIVENADRLQAAADDKWRKEPKQPEEEIPQKSEARR